MMRSFVRWFLLLVWLGGVADVAMAQTTSVASPTDGIQMGGVSLASGAAVFVPVDVYGHPIPVTVSGMGINLPGSAARPVGYPCAITGGAISACNIPDEVASSPSGFCYNVTVTDTTTGNPTSGMSFKLPCVHGITGTSFRLDEYTPIATVPTVAAMTHTSGSGAPTGACTEPAQYFDKTGHALYECSNGSWVQVSGTGGGGSSTIFPSGLLYGGNSTSAPTVATSLQVQSAIGSGVYDAAGAAAAATASALQKSANLSDLQSASTARGNLGLGSAAIQNTTAFDAAGAATAAAANSIQKSINYGGINIFGDSIPQGTGSTNFMSQGLSATGFAQMLLSDFGGNGQNFGVGGDQAADMSMKVYANANPTVSNNFITVLHIGNNDAVHYGVDANKENNFTRAVESSAAWPGISDANKFYTNDTNFCTRGGTWGVDAGAARGAISSNVNGSSLTCNVTVPAGGKAIYYGYAACDSWSPGQASILIDGSSPSNDAIVLSYGQGGAAISTANGAICSMFVARYPVSVGTHTFTITVSSASGFVEPRWIGVPIIDTTSTAPPNIYVAGVPWAQGGTTSDAQATYNTLVANAVSTMYADNLPVYFVDLRNGTNTHNSDTTTPLNNSTDYAGGVEGNITCPASAFLPYHPNSSAYPSRSCGHGHIAANFETAIGIKAGGPQGSNVVSGRTLSPNGFLASANVGSATGSSAAFGVSANGDMRQGSMAGWYYDSNMHWVTPLTSACHYFDQGNSPAAGVSPTITNLASFCNTMATFNTAVTINGVLTVNSCTGCGGGSYAQVTSEISGASGANAAGLKILGNANALMPTHLLSIVGQQAAFTNNVTFNGANWVYDVNGAGSGFRFPNTNSTPGHFQLDVCPVSTAGATAAMDTTCVVEWDQYSSSGNQVWVNPQTQNPSFPTNAAFVVNPSANVFVDFSGNMTVAGGGNTLYRCTTAGTLPVGALTAATGNCGASVDTGLRVH